MKTLVSVVIALLVVGNVVSVALLFQLSPASPGSPSTGFEDSGLLTRLGELDDRLERIERDLSLRTEAGAVPTGGESTAVVSAPAVDLSPVIERLSSMERAIQEMRDVEAELDAEKLRQTRQQQFTEEDGYTVADALLAERKFNVAANGYLEFLKAHPDHPDARDLMNKAAQAFHGGGYTEKAVWLKEQMLEQFPESRGDLLYDLALFNKQLDRYDQAIAQVSESAELAPTDERRMWRLLYRAYLVSQRDGNQAAIPLYAEIEKSALAAGASGPAREARQKIALLEGDGGETR